MILARFIVLIALQLSNVNNIFKTYNNAINTGQSTIMVSNTEHEILYSTISRPNILWSNHKEKLTKLKNDK